MNFRVAMVDNLDGHLFNFIFFLIGPHQNFKIESPTVCFTLRENILGDIGPECLEAALRIAELKASRQGKDSYICLGSQPSQRRISLVSFRMQPS